MHLRQIAAAMAGGAVAAALLAIPLGLALPGWWVPAWGRVPWLLQGLAYSAAGAVVVQVGRASAGGRMGAGAAAGGLAGAVVYVMIGAAAAGVASVGGLLAAMPLGGDEDARVSLLVDAVARAAWAQPLALGALLAAGSVLGVVGARLATGGPDAASPPVRGSASMWFTTVLLVGAALLAVAAGTDMIETVMVPWAREHGRAGPWGVVTVPTLTCAVALAASLWALGQSLRGGWHHVDEASRALSRFHAVAVSGFVVVGFGLVGITHPALFVRPAVAAGLGLVAVAAGWALYTIVVPTPSAGPLVGATLSESVGHSLFGAVLRLAILGAGGAGMGLALTHGAVPYVVTLARPEEAPAAVDTIRDLYTWLALFPTLALGALSVMSLVQKRTLEWLRPNPLRASPGAPPPP